MQQQQQLPGVQMGLLQGLLPLLLLLGLLLQYLEWL
jgi:hypothetical protein